MLNRFLKFLKKVIPLLALLISFKALYAENLVEIYLLAIKNDPVLLSAQQNQLAEREQLIIARSRMLPNVSWSGNQGYAKQTDKLYGLQGRKYNHRNYSLSINQPIFQIIDWRNYSVVQKQTALALKKYEDVEQKLLLRVAEQYFAVLVAIDQLDTSKAVKEAVAKRLEQANKQFKVGLAAITDINEAQAKLDSAKAKEIADRNALNTAWEGLSQIIGKVIDNILPLKPEIPLLSPEPLDVSVWLEKARKNNLKLQAARLEAEVAKDNIKVASSKHLPTLNASGNITRAKTPPPGVDKMFTKEVSLGLSFPIFSGGAIVAGTQTAIFKANAELQQLELAYRDVESNTRMAYNSILTQISQVEALAQSVNSSKTALKATQAAFEAGTRTIVDVLNAQSDLLNTQKDYAKARYDYIINCLKLKQAIGVLNVIDLEQVNSLLKN